MKQENKLASLQLAKLFLNLAEVERLIQNEILPAMASIVTGKQIGRAHV